MKILEERHTETKKELAFFTKDTHELMYSFPLTDEKVIPLDTNGVPCSEENCTWWSNYLKVKEDENMVSEIEEDSFTIPAKALCDCGKEIFLENVFYGTCECPYCNRWYNMFGQRCLPPEEQMQLEDW